MHPDHRGEETLEPDHQRQFRLDQPSGPRLCRAVGVLSLRRPQRGKRTADADPRAGAAGDGRARALLGAAFRVAHLISAARTGVLPATHFRSQGRKLMLVFEHRMVDLVADRVGSRFKQLARLVGRAGSIVRN